MSIDDWARREAEQYAHGDVYGDIQLGFRAGVVSLADALLSDEAVEAAAIGYWKASVEDLDVSEGPTAEELERFVWATRIVVQAAVDAVTKEARNA